MAPSHTISSGIEDVWAGVAIVPVLTIPDPATAVPLSRALSRGGLKVVEIKLRTGASLEALESIAADGGDPAPGAGTVLRPDPVGTATRPGGQQLVSPSKSRQSPYPSKQK